MCFMQANESTTSQDQLLYICHHNNLGIEGWGFDLILRTILEMSDILKIRYNNPISDIIQVPTLFSKLVHLSILVGLVAEPGRPEPDV